MLIVVASPRKLDRPLKHTIVPAINLSYARGIISRHYFSGMSIGHMAQEYGITKQAVYDREQKASQSIRARRYGAELAEFIPSMSKKERANRWIKRDREAVTRLQLSDTEKELLAL